MTQVILNNYRQLAPRISQILNNICPIDYSICSSSSAGAAHIHTATTTTTSSQLFNSSTDTTSIGHNSDPHLSNNSGEKKRKSRRGCRAGVGRKKPRLSNLTTVTAPSPSTPTAGYHVREPTVLVRSSTNIHTAVPPYTSAAAEAAAAIKEIATSKPAHTNTITDTYTNIVMTTVSERLLTRHVKSVKRSVRIDSASQVYNTQDLPSSLPSQHQPLSQERGQNYDLNDDVREENDENKMIVNDSQVSNVSVRVDENNRCWSATRTDIGRAADVDAVGDKPSSQHASTHMPQVLLLL